MREESDTPRERAYCLATGSSSSSIVMVSFLFIASGTQKDTYRIGKDTYMSTVDVFRLPLAHGKSG